MKLKIKLKHPKVLIFSLIALGFLALAYLIDWLFLIGAVALVILNQKELMGKRK